MEALSVHSLDQILIISFVFCSADEYKPKKTIQIIFANQIKKIKDDQEEKSTCNDFVNQKPFSV